VVRVERTRRLAAVEEGARAAEERFAAEQRALEAEREVESERRRLSQEIHDGVSQRVYMLSLGLENARVSAEREGAPALAARLETLHQVSRETLLETRNLLFDLGRVMAGQTTIDELARNLATEFSAVTGVAVEVRAAAAQAAMDPASVGELFRIIQEALANVMKHAAATNVVIALKTSGSALQVTVADNGSGFEVDAARMGHGLNNIRERAARLGGSATIESSPGAGTTVRVSLPLAEEAPS
jgi:signal transduction histidine kinase